MTYSRSTGVSPIIGVILLVGVTVILSASVGMFVISQGPPQQTPTSSLQVEEQPDGVHVTALSLNTRVEVRYNGATVHTFQKGDTGEEYVVEQTMTGSQVTVVAAPDSGTDRVLSTHTVETTTVNVTSGLIAYYPLDSLTNQTAVDVAGQHPGTIHGNVSRAAGVVGSGARFYNLGDYINVTNVPDPTTTGAAESFTVTFWLKPISGTDSSPIVEWDDTTSWNAHIWQFSSETDFFFNSPNTDTQKASGAVHLDRFAFYTVVFDGRNDRIKMYVNNSLVLNQSETGAPVTNGEMLRLGSRYNGTQGDTNKYLNGTLDEVRIYNQPLNKSQRVALYQQGS